MADVHEGDDGVTKTTDAANAYSTRPDEADPYQIETVVVRPDVGRADQKMADLLDTHVMSRAKVADIAATRTQILQTVSERLLSSGIIPRPRARRSHTDDGPPRSTRGSDSLDLINALGVEPPQPVLDDGKSVFLQPLLVWLVEACQFTDGAQRRTQYCDVLLRIAEECGTRGYAGVSALTLRYRRALLGGEDTLTVDAASTHMMQWPLLLDAYLRDSRDLYAIDALLNHVAEACDSAAIDSGSLDRLADTMLADTSRNIQLPDAPEDWISRAGDTVFGAGRVRLLSGAAGRRLLRLRTALDDVPRTAEMAGVRRRMRALLKELDERVIDLDQTGRLQQAYARTQHTEITRTWRVSAQESFASVTQAARSAGMVRDINVHVQPEVEDFRLDKEASEVLADPIAGLAWWGVTHGMGTPGTRAEVLYRARKEGTSIHFELKVSGHGIDMYATSREFGVDKPNQLVDRLLTLAADTTTAGGHSAALSASFARLHHGVARLGGVCELLCEDDGALHFVGSFPDWLTTTRGHLCPVGGGIVTVREAGVARVTEADPSAFSNDSGKRLVRVDGSKYQALQLAELLGISAAEETGASAISILLVPVAGTTYAIETPGISEALPLPLRAVTSSLPKTPGVVGGTVLIGGEISPVIDLQTLILAVR